MATWPPFFYGHGWLVCCERQDAGTAMHRTRCMSREPWMAVVTMATDVLAALDHPWSSRHSNIPVHRMSREARVQGVGGRMTQEPKSRTPE